ncbi:DoxX family protein [Streptomyces sp. NPDC052236]|uniref:DoxX family protein n=1 Tax=Streptomyces sp. NPDC052236 TaxID=3365686 RepID=UPI0037D876F7
MSRQATSSANRPGRAAEIALWVFQALLVLVFLAAGFAKLVGAEAMVESFDDIGAGQWLRYVTGVVEVVGAFGLLVPRLVGLAALGLAVEMIGAVITNFVVDAPSILAVVLLVLAAMVAWGRRDRIGALIRPGAVS